MCILQETEDTHTKFLYGNFKKNFILYNKEYEDVIKTDVTGSLCGK